MEVSGNCRADCLVRFLGDPKRRAPTRRARSGQIAGQVADDRRNVMQSVGQSHRQRGPYCRGTVLDIEAEHEGSMFWIDMNSFSHSDDRNNGSVRGIGDSI
jgi:hypothetical protein